MSKTVASLFASIKVNTNAWVLGCLLAGASVSSWHAAVEFTRLRSAIQGQWSYPMEKESWDKFGRMNPAAGVPDVEKIRKDHIAGPNFHDNSAVISQN